MVAAEGAARPAEISRDQARATLSEIRERRGLYARPDLDRWMSANDLDPASMERLVEGQARLEALRERFGRSIGPALLDELRISGFYAPFAERALKKQEARRSVGPMGGDRATKGSTERSSAAVVLRETAGQADARRHR